MIIGGAVGIIVAFTEYSPSRYILKTYGETVLFYYIGGMLVVGVALLLFIITLKKRQYETGGN